jgi:uncharacterized membrane protein (DUF485 family)
MNSLLLYFRVYLIMEPVQYPYSKAKSTFFVGLGLILIGMSIFLFIKFVPSDDVNWGMFLLFLLVALSLVLTVLYVIVNYLIPAFQNKVALEINSDEIISYAKDVTVPWTDVEEVTIFSGRYSSSLYIKFKHETDQGDSISIGLQYVKGDGEKIYDKALSYFEQSE